MIKKIAISLLIACVGLAGLLLSGVLQPTYFHENHRVDQNKHDGGSGVGINKTGQSGQGQEKVDDSNDSRIHKKLLAYILSSSETLTETDMQSFLGDELKLDKKSEANYLRICFWNKFITLQQKKQGIKPTQILTAFARELELKQASFDVRGLKLDSQDIGKARQEIESLVELLDPEKNGGAE